MISGIPHEITLFLSWTGGVGTTVLGSWLTSRLKAYEDARNAHRDEIKHKILEPLRDLLSRYGTPTFSVEWKTQIYNPLASSFQNPATQGPTLILGEQSDPGANADSCLDEVLFEDAKTNHHRDLLAAWEHFRTSWTSQIASSVEWIDALANDILARSGLPPHPPPRGQGPYIMHQAFAEFIYNRLILQSASTVAPEAGPEGHTRLGDGQRTLAYGLQQQMDTVRELIDQLLDDHRPWAAQYLEQVYILQSERAALQRRFSLAIAARKLKRPCPLVTFF